MLPLRISGIDIDAALDLYNGELDTYIYVLKSYYTNTPTALDKIRSVGEDLTDYVIAIHGIKSVSAMIGANDISDRAKELEMMGKAGDRSGILQKNDRFIMDVEVLINEIKTFVEKHDD